MRKTTKVSLLAATLLGICTVSQAEDLMDIYKEAYARDPVIQQYKAQRDAAYAAVDQATAALLPQIDVTGSYTATRTNVSSITHVRANNRNASAGISLSQALWQHSSWVNRSIAAKTAARAELAYNDALQNLIVRVSAAYFAVLNANDALEYSKANNVALKNQLDEALRQLQVGLIAETDKLEAQAAYDLSTAAVINAENNLINSYEGLRTLIGRLVTVNELKKLDTKRFSTPAVTKALQNIIKDAEANNLQLQQSIVDRDIAKDNIALAKTGHEPTLNLVAAAQTGYTDYSHEVPGSSQTDGNSWSQSLGLNLNVPIYHGGSVSAQVEQAEHNYVAASQTLELAHRNLLTTVNNSYNNVNAAISSVRAYNQSVASAASALDATRAGYEVGTRTMTDVLDATQNLYNAMQQAAAARYNYINSTLSLKYAEGILQVQDIEDVNTALTK